MVACSEVYKQRNREGAQPSDTNFEVQYFSDNAVSRIDSCRDKLALLAWSFYCAFNPEEKVLDYGQVIERLKYPIKFGLNLKGHEAFLRQLLPLQGNDFKRIEQYRHLKIHKREPRIEIYGVKPHHDWSYMIPLTDPGEIKAWRARVAKQGSSASWVERNSRIRGVIFDRKVLKGRLWSFNEIKADVENCLLKLLKATGGCCRILQSRRPIRRSRRRYP